MIYTKLDFLELTEEFPNIDTEIRSILLTRAQNGSTLSEIRDDYYELTGIKFPIYENVTDFLLSIPNVMVYCNENGTRIFNIMPNKKNKHLFEMITNQKTHQKQLRQTHLNTKVNGQYYRNSNLSEFNTYKESNNNCLATKQYHNRKNNCQHEQKSHPHVNEDTTYDITNNRITPTNSDDSNQNYYYRDNYNYLLNRMISNQPCKAQSRLEIATSIDNIDMKTDTSSHQTEYHCHHKHHHQHHHHKQKQQNQQQQKQCQNYYQQEANQCVNDLKGLLYQNNLNHFLCCQETYQYQSEQQYICQPEQNKNSLHRLKPHDSLSNRFQKNCYSNDKTFLISDYEAHLLDFLLLGDDFFLYMARMELGCKFKKNESILQSGLCISGQSIHVAIKRIKQLEIGNRSVIINIGSVDIMQRQQLIQIEHDFRELIDTMQKKNITPIITTLAPLANYVHYDEIRNTVTRFNEFIKREGEKRNLLVIDIWQCLVNDKQQTLFDCYQNEPRLVTGTSEPYLFWNKIGRQRVLRLIESQLEY